MNCGNVVLSSRQKFPLTSAGIGMPSPACVDAEECIRFTSLKFLSLSPRGYF